MRSAPSFSRTLFGPDHRTNTRSTSPANHNSHCSGIIVPHAKVSAIDHHPQDHLVLLLDELARECQAAELCA